MQSPIFRSGPLSIGDLLDWAVRLYRARFGKLILTAAIFLVPIGVLSGIISGQTMTSYLQVFFQAIQDPDILSERQFLADLQGDSNMVALSYLLMPLSIAVSGLSTLALTRQALATILNEELTIGASIGQAFRRFWAWLAMILATYAAYLGLIILVTIAFFIIFLFFAVVASGVLNLGNIAEGSEPGTAAFAGLMIGLLCLYIGAIILAISPFIYLATRWAVAIPILMDQQIGPLEALSESWRLTQGNTRHALGYVVLLYLLYGALYLAVMTIALLVSTLTLTSNLIASIAIFGTVSALLPILWQPLSIAAYTTLYYDLRMRNQGYDIEMRIQQLEAEVARDA